jgi:nucleotide-binding universal stress UspA family protein
MRVLIAIDGSPQVGAARHLVASLPWPEETRILVVGVIQPSSTGATGLVPYAMPETDRRAVEAAVDGQLADAAATLGSPSRVVEARRFHGRPASVIVEQAARFRADLVVVGSRGLGPIRSMLLGSVSAEVVDHAPCPVLVVRTPAVGSIMLAVDGSVSAERALRHLCDADYLASHRVEVLSVSPLLHGGILPPQPDTTALAGGHDRSPMTVDWHRADARAAMAADDLRREGMDARPSVAVGDAAHEIIRAAEDLQCGLIVMGSRGLTGLERVRVGSVARNVLLHAHASVLIVRETVRAEPVSTPGDEVRRADLAAV